MLMTIQHYRQRHILEMGILGHDDVCWRMYDSRTVPPRNICAHFATSKGQLNVCSRMTWIFHPPPQAKRLRKADPVGNANIYAEYERHDWSYYGILKRTLFRPFQMLALEPILVLITMYMCIVYGLIYALLEALPIIFVVRRGFSTSQGGLIFIAVAIGTTLGSFVNAYLSRNYKELIKKWRGFPPPEYRLWSALIGAPTLVIAIFWLGWTGEYASIPWYVPGPSTIMVGLGISLIFISFMVGCTCSLLSRRC